MKFEETPEYKDIRIAALLKQNAKFAKKLKDIKYCLLYDNLLEIDFNDILEQIEQTLSGYHNIEIKEDPVLRQDIQEIYDKLK